jgi:membrane-associated phospholipid phosphatase
MSKQLKTILVAVAILAVMGILTLFDLQISKLLFYESNLFGRFFEIFGEFPAFLIGAFCLAAMIVTRDRANKLKSLTAMLGFGILLLLVSLMAVTAIAGYLGKTFSPVLLVFAALIMAAALFAAGRVPRSQARDLRLAAVVGFTTLIAEILLVNLVKVGWGRPRFRSMTDIVLQFTPWYLPQVLASGEEFKSFPSGHSANAAVTMWLALLPAFLPALKGREKILTGIAVIWTTMVMVSRVIMGAHFATDTVAGVLITWGVFSLVSYLVYHRKARAVKPQFASGV